MTPKNVNELSIEELLASLLGEDLSKENIAYSFTNPVASFIQAFNLIDGDEFISSKLLYRLYKAWSKLKPIGLTAFTIKMNDHLVGERRNLQYYYKVSTKVLDIAQKLEEIQKKRSRNRAKSLAWHKHFEAFLKENELEPGNVFVEIDILFYIYNNWCDRTRKKAGLGPNTFHAICSLNFENKRISNSKLAWFGINDKIKELITPEEVDRWRQGRNRHGNKEINKPFKGFRKGVLHPKKEVKKK